MKAAKTISLFGVMAMAVVLIYAFVDGNFFSEGRKLLTMPWGFVSLVDLYIGFILFSLWIIYREASILSAILWTFAMMVLGFFAGSLYIFLALQRSNQDWKIFWLGKNAQ